MPVNPAPIRQTSKQYPTPVIDNLVFWESKEVSREALPAYGTLHPDQAKYPGFQFSFAEQMDDQGLWFKMYFIAARENQDQWNAEIKFFYGGNPDFPRLTRTYLLERGDGPGQAFEKIPLGTVDPVYPNARLLTSYVVQSDAPYTSLYMTVIRVYGTIPGSGGGGGGGSGEDQADLGYSVERPIQTKDWLRLTWQLTLPREVADNSLTPDLDPCPINSYENLLLVDEKIIGNNEENQTVTVQRIYEGDQSPPDADPSPIVKKKVRELPGALPPDKFCSVVTTTDDNTIVLAPNDYDVSTVTAPSGTLARVSVSPDGGKLRGNADSQYAAFTTTALTGRAWDNNLKTFVSYQVEVMTPAAAATYAAGIGAGVEVTISPFSPYWSIVTTQSPSTGTIGGGSPTVKYYVTHPYTWPAVLLDLQYGAIGLRPAPGEAPTDGATFFYDYTLKPAWSGLCKAEIQIAFMATDPLSAATEIPTQQLAPNEISIRWPGVAQLAIPECLHPEITFTGRTGTDNPRYEDVAFSKTWLASQFYTGGTPVDQDDWPESIIAGFQVEPYMNGFIVTQLKIFKPF